MRYRITDGVQYIDHESTTWNSRLSKRDTLETLTLVRIVAPVFFKTVDVRIRFSETDYRLDAIIIHTTPFADRTQLQAAVLKAGKNGLIELKDAEVWLL